MIIHNYCIANNYLISLTLRKLGLLDKFTFDVSNGWSHNKQTIHRMHTLQDLCNESPTECYSLFISIDITLMLYELCQSPKWRSILEVQYLYPHNLSTSLPDNWSNASAVLSYIKYNIAYINCFHPSDNGCVRTTCE